MAGTVLQDATTGDPVGRAALYTQDGSGAAQRVSSANPLAVTVDGARASRVAQKTTITSSTAETTILSSVASTFLDLYGLVITNTSASACTVTIKDATAGTTRIVFQVPAGDTRGFMVNPNGAHSQAVSANNWTATCGTSVASIEITALAVKAT